jgi:hypothetical protein
LGTLYKEAIVLITTRTFSWQLLISLGLSACFVGGEFESETLIGSWESREVIDDSRNSLFIEDEDGDIAGSATIYFYLGNDPQRYVLDFMATVTTIETNREYLVDMVCAEDYDCSEFNFTMDCSVINATNLDCSGSDAFATYSALYFERSTE